MTEKTSLAVRCLKHLYGIDGVLDEYKRHEINRIGNNAFILLTGGLFLLDLVAIFAAAAYPSTDVLLALLLGLPLSITGVMAYVSWMLRKLRLDDIEVAPADLGPRLKRLRWRALFVGGYFAVWMFLMTLGMNWWFDGVSLAASLEALATYRTAGLDGLIFGVWMYVVWRLRVKVIR